MTALGGPQRLHDRPATHLRELAEWNQKHEQRCKGQVAPLERLGRLKRFFSPQLAELIMAGGTVARPQRRIGSKLRTGSA